MAIQTTLTALGYETDMIIPATTVRQNVDGNGTALGIKDASGRLSMPNNQLAGLNLYAKSLVKQRNGLATTTALAAGAVKSYLNQMTLPAHCVGIQIGLQNAHPTSSPQVRIRIGFSESAPDPSQPLNALTQNGVTPTVGADIDAGYAIATRNGAQVSSLPAFGGAGVTQLYTTWWDVMPIISRKRTDAGRELPVLNVITELFAVLNGLNTAMTITEQFFDTNIAGWEVDDPAGRMRGNFYRCRSAAVAGGVSPALMNQTTPSVGTSAAILIRYFLQTPCGLQTVQIHDSTGEGTGAASADKFGGLQRAVFQHSTMARPIELLNAAQAGTDPQKFATMAQSILPEVKNSLVFYPIGSVNQGMPLTNTITSASIVGGGSGGTPGPVTLTGTTGTGTKFQIAAVIGAGGSVVSLGGVTTPGLYTVLPTDLAAEPVTGSTLSGCILSLVTLGTLLPLNRKSISLIEQAANANDCALVQKTWMPTNTSGIDFKGSDIVRRQLNDELRASGRVYIDSAAAVEGALLGSQAQFLSGKTTDNTHPNDAGYDDEALKFGSLLTALTGN